MTKYENKNLKRNQIREEKFFQQYNYFITKLE